MENSLKNREKIYESITHASISAPTRSQPSTSTTNDLTPKVPTTKNDNKSTDAGINPINFSDEFEINDEDLAKIDNLDQPEVLNSSPTPSFTTANNKKIVINNRQSTLPTHFLTKPPIKIFSKKSETKQPQNETATHASEQIPKFLSTNPSVVYENCVFHGNIVNNFYYSSEQTSKSCSTNRSHAYKNCVFHKNTVNNFHYSCEPDKKNK